MLTYKLFLYRKYLRNSYRTESFQIVKLLKRRKYDKLRCEIDEDDRGPIKVPSQGVF